MSNRLERFEIFREAGLDGIAASTTEPEVLESARQLLRYSPAGISEPDVSVGMNGSICLEWRSLDGLLVDVTIGPGSLITVSRKIYSAHFLTYGPRIKDHIAGLLREKDGDQDAEPPT